MSAPIPPCVSTPRKIRHSRNLPIAHPPSRKLRAETVCVTGSQLIFAFFELLLCVDKFDAMTRKFMFTITGLTKTLPDGSRTILKNINLCFFPGAKIGVVGLNGSGKSSLLKIMAGVDKSFTGTAVPMVSNPFVSNFKLMTVAASPEPALDTYLKSPRWKGILSWIT